MKILTLRTDKPESEIGIYEGNNHLKSEQWEAHRSLAETIHTKIDELLKSQAIKSENLGGIVVYQGPGSFTGLRIGISVANAMVYSLKIPIIGTTGDDWAGEGLGKILAGQNQNVILPEYGGPAHTTASKK